MHTYFAVIGNLEALRGKKGWGSAERSGFDKKKKTAQKPPAAQQPVPPAMVDPNLN
jgi:hypothetical protein